MKLGARLSFGAKWWQIQTGMIFVFLFFWNGLLNHWKAPAKWTLRQRFESFYRGEFWILVRAGPLFCFAHTHGMQCFDDGAHQKPGLLTLACLPLGPECLSSISLHFKMAEIEVSSCCSCLVSGSFVLYLRLKYL